MFSFLNFMDNSDLIWLFFSDSWSVSVLFFYYNVIIVSWVPCEMMAARQQQIKGKNAKKNRTVHSRGVTSRPDWNLMSCSLGSFPGYSHILRVLFCPSGREWASKTPNITNHLLTSLSSQRLWRLDRSDHVRRGRGDEAQDVTELIKERTQLHTRGTRPRWKHVIGSTSLRTEGEPARLD